MGLFQNIHSMGEDCNAQFDFLWLTKFNHVFPTAFHFELLLPQISKLCIAVLSVVGSFAFDDTQ